MLRLYNKRQKAPKRVPYGVCYGNRIVNKKIRVVLAVIFLFAFPYGANDENDHGCDQREQK